MTLYKAFTDFQQQFHKDVIFNNTFLDLDEEINNNNVTLDEETLELFQKYLSILLFNPPVDFFSQMPNIVEIIKTNSNNCMEYILPDHFQRIISCILMNEYSENAIYFLDFLLSQYPTFSQFDGFIQLSEILFKNIANFFSVSEMNDNIEHLQRIIFNSIPNNTIRDIFINSECMKELVKHIKNYDEDNQDQLLLVSLEIMKFLTNHNEIPKDFEENIYTLLTISTSDTIESILSLQILIQIMKYSEIDIFKNINEYRGIESTYIEDLVSFLKEPNNFDKRVASFKFLSALSKYGDPILKLMINQNTLFEVKEALKDKNDKIVVQALKFFIKWLQNAKEYEFTLTNYICSINFSSIFEDTLYEAKYCFLKLMINLSQNAKPNHIVQLIQYDLLVSIVEQIDETDLELSQKIIEFLKYIVVKCQATPDFIKMIENELMMSELRDPLLIKELDIVLELIKSSS